MRSAAKRRCCALPRGQHTRADFRREPPLQRRNEAPGTARLEPQCGYRCDPGSGRRLGYVALHHGRRTQTLVRLVMKSRKARIHRRGQHEAAGKLSDMAARAMVRYHPRAVGASPPATSGETQGAHPETARHYAPAKLRPDAEYFRRRLRPLRPRWSGGGERNGRCTTKPASAFENAGNGVILVVSSASSSRSGARIEGSRLASMVFPEPGGPIMRMLMAAAAEPPKRVWPSADPRTYFEVEREVLKFARR